MTADNVDFEKESTEGDGSTGGALVSETTFKGRPVLVLRRSSDDKYPFSLGLGKCKLICENIQAVEAFIKKHG